MTGIYCLNILIKNIAHSHLNFLSLDCTALALGSFYACLDHTLW